MKSVLIVFLVIIFLIAGINSCTEEPDNPWTNFDGSPIVCRRTGCGRTPMYSDWNRRYCSTHIQEDHYCRYPGCLNPIPNSSTRRYCSEHD